MAAFQIVQVEKDNPHRIDRTVLSLRHSDTTVESVFTALTKCEKIWGDLNSFYWTKEDIRFTRNSGWVDTEDYVYHVWMC